MSERAEVYARADGTHAVIVRPEQMGHLMTPTEARGLANEILKAATAAAQATGNPPASVWQCGLSDYAPGLTPDRYRAGRA